MLTWRFKTYVAPGGKTDVQDTIDRYGDDGREAFCRAVMHLAVRPISAWNEPHAKKLKGQRALYEIRFKADLKPARALGFFFSARTFAITLIATHKQNVYTPREAFDIATRRFERIQAGTATLATLQIVGEDFPQDDG